VTRPLDGVVTEELTFNYSKIKRYLSSQSGPKFYPAQGGSLQEYGRKSVETTVSSL
jgi:hypothetical protein